MNKKYIIIAALVLLITAWVIAFKFYYLDWIVPSPTQDSNIVVENDPIETNNNDFTPQDMQQWGDEVEFSQDYFERPNIEINSRSNVDE